MNTPLKSPFITEMENKLTHENINDVTALIKEKLIQQSPIIEDIPHDKMCKLVTFLYEIEKDDDIAYFISILTAKPQPVPMQRLGKSTFCYYSTPVENTIRTSYGFGLNFQSLPESFDFSDEKIFDEIMYDFGKKSRVDPYNPKKMVFRNEELNLDFSSSILEMPDSTPAIWSIHNPSVSKGTLIKQKIMSQHLNREQQYWVYTPADYNLSHTYPMVLFFDGEMHIEKSGTGLATALDNLIASEKVPPMIAVMVNNFSIKSRHTDLMCNETFAIFLMEELLPAIKKDHSISPNRDDCVVQGCSLGGLFALYLALRYPCQFGKALCNSPSFWGSKINCNNILDILIKENESPKIDIYIDLGVLEAVSWGDVEMLGPINHIEALLQQYGHEVTYYTFAGGHDIFWHVETIPDALIKLFNPARRNLTVHAM